MKANKASWRIDVILISEFLFSSFYFKIITFLTQSIKYL
jgi:hypothetical protein